MTTEVRSIDLRVGQTERIPLRLNATVIELRIDPPIRLRPSISPIELRAATTVFPLRLAGTFQGPRGADGAGAETLGPYVAGETITSSSLTHLAEADGLLYLADFELDRPANCFTIAGCTIGQSLTVYRSGLLNGLAGIVPGKQYWLGNAGQLRTTCPDHGVTQRCGDGASATEVIVSLFEDVDWEG